MILNKSKHTETETLLARQLGHLIRSGLSYEDAFAKLEEAGRGGLKQEVEALRQDLEPGQPRPRKERRFATPVASLREMMAIAREEGGNAADILGNAEEILGSLGESYHVYWAGMASFLWYITGLSLIMFLLLIVFTIFVFPQFEELYANAQGAIPELTRMTIDLLGTLREAFFILMVAIVIGLIIITYNIRMAMKRLEPLTGLIARIPGLGTLCRNYNSALLINLSRLLASSGIALDTAIQRIWEMHKPGENFAGAMSSSESKLNFLLTENPVWGSIVLSRLTGTLEAEIVYLSSKAETIFAEQLAKLREEFTLIAQITVGVVIAILVISMYLPIFKLGSIF